MFDAAVAAGVLRIRRPDARWLSTGWDGGFHDTDVAYNVSVPQGWDRTDVGRYADERRRRADFPDPGPALLTGVDLEHLRGARIDPVEVYATAGLSNPAALPMAPSETDGRAGPAGGSDGSGPGTVNLIVGTDRALDDGALASLVSVAVEAKAATLLAETGFPGTTTDAVIAGTDPDGEPAAFAGSATTVGGAARACVRDAVTASLRSRYSAEPMPVSVADAEYGLRSEQRAEVFKP